MSRAAVITFLAAGLLVVGGCGKGFSKRGQESAVNTFRYPIVNNPTTLDPAKVQDGDTIDIVQNVYEGLVKWNEESKPVPNLAESWDVSPDGRTYTFHIKHGVKFHNGRELTADDFKFSFERACNPDLGSPTAETYLTDIVGVRDRLNGKAKDVQGVQVVDPYTLKLTIDKPRAYFISKLTYPVYFPVAKEACSPDKEITKVDEMVGTGPFKFEKVVDKQIVILDAFADYHDGKPSIDKIERPVVGDAAARLNKFKAGELDMVALERQDLPGLQSDPKFKDQLHFYARPSLYYIGMNTKVYAPFANAKVRRALFMAIDKQKIVDQVLGGVNVVANAIVPPGVLGHRDKTACPEYNPAEARKLLAEAGYPNAKGMGSVELMFRADRPDIGFVAEAVAAQLKTNLNMDVKLQNMEWGAFLEKNNKKIQPFVHMRWAADYLDPQNFLSLLLASYGAENKLNYHNPAYDALCQQADTEPNEQKRLELYAKAEDMVLQDGTIIPIYFQRDAELISPRVSGLRDSLFGHLPHTTVSLK